MKKSMEFWYYMENIYILCVVNFKNPQNTRTHTHTLNCKDVKEFFTLPRNSIASHP